jgi:uncharacterized protein involved in exopolysaccharide biosynthesis
MDSKLEYTANDYLDALRRRRKLFLLVALPIIACAALIAAMLPDKYTSFADINIDLEGSNIRTLEPIEVTSYAEQYITKLTDLALSRENMLALAADPEIISATPSGVSEAELVGQIRKSINVSVLTQLVLSPRSGREVDLISGFRVESEGADPELVFQVADNLAKLFLDADRSTRTERASSTSLFLSEQMNQTEVEILGLEKEVAAFKVANACCLPELVGLNTAAMQRAERDIENSQPRLRALEQDKIFLQAQLAEVAELDQFNTGADRLLEIQQEYMTLLAKYGSEHPDVNRLRREIVALTNGDAITGDAVEIFELRAKLSEAEQRYSSEHPDVIRYKNELALLESKRELTGNAGQNRLLDNPRYLQLRAELNSVDSQLTELRTSQPVLRQKIADYESRLARTPQVESEFEAISRRLQSARDNFDDLQRRSIIAEQSEALESKDIGARLAQVVAPVKPDSPTGPPRIAILILGIFLAGTLGVGSMLFTEMTDGTVRGSKDVIRAMDMVPLATVPVIATQSSLEHNQRRLYFARGSMLVVIVVIALYVLF